VNFLLQQERPRFAAFSSRVSRQSPHDSGDLRRKEKAGAAGAVWIKFDGKPKNVRFHGKKKKKMRFIPFVSIA